MVGFFKKWRKVVNLVLIAILTVMFVFPTMALTIFPNEYSIARLGNLLETYQEGELLNTLSEERKSEIITNYSEYVSDLAELLEPRDLSKDEIKQQELAQQVIDEKKEEVETLSGAINSYSELKESLYKDGFNEKAQECGVKIEQLNGELYVVLHNLNIYSASDTMQPYQIKLGIVYTAKGIYKAIRMAIMQSKLDELNDIYEQRAEYEAKSGKESSYGIQEEYQLKEYITNKKNTVGIVDDAAISWYLFLFGNQIESKNEKTFGISSENYNLMKLYYGPNDGADEYYLAFRWVFLLCYFILFIVSLSITIKSLFKPFDSAAETDLESGIGRALRLVLFPMAFLGGSLTGIGQVVILLIVAGVAFNAADYYLAKNKGAKEKMGFAVIQATSLVAIGGVLLTIGGLRTLNPLRVPNINIYAFEVTYGDEFGSVLIAILLIALCVGFGFVRSLMNRNISCFVCSDSVETVLSFIQIGIVSVCWGVPLIFYKKAGCIIGGAGISKIIIGLVIVLAAVVARIFLPKVVESIGKSHDKVETSQSEC